MGRLKRTSLQLGVGIVSLAFVAAACGSTKTGSGGSAGGGSTAGLANQRYADNSTGTPKVGGTLTMLGVGDVDYMDPNISYYTIGYLDLMLWSRQLYNYPSIHGKTTDVVPDLATAAPKVSSDGLHYTVTIRKGAMWNTTPARQVNAADVVRGVKRSCNPTSPFGGQPDFSDFLAGYQTFCTGFGNVSATDAGAQAAYINSHAISGVTPDPTDSSGLTIDFTLTKPASYFEGILTLPPFAPAPVEILKYLPGSNDLAQHTVSDGPYMIKSYDPAKTIVYVRNPAWQASSDPIRKAYVDTINVNETGNEASIFQQVSTNTSSADMEWDTGVPPSQIPGLIAKNDPRFSTVTEFASNPYIIFNTQSPNNASALQKAAVRQALSEAIDRSQLIQVAGGPQINPPLTHFLPPGMAGSTQFDLYPFNLTKAKSDLAAAGASHLTLKFLYRPASITSSKMFQTVQSLLTQAGISVTGVQASNADFYTKYLQKPDVAKRGVWDLSLAGWGPDWYPDGAKSFFEPLVDGRILPPTSSNYGLFNDATVNTDIDSALKATTAADASNLWHQADMAVMQAAAIYPITDPNEPTIHGSQVHNCIYMSAIQNCNPANVWLSS